MPRLPMDSIVRLALAAAILALPGCLEWDPTDVEATSAPEPPDLGSLTPSGMPPIASFDPGDTGGRCGIACRRYVECFGPAVAESVCIVRCASELWVRDAGDLACYVWSPCSSLSGCREE